MKKFSKLNESVKIDQSKLESILSELEGVTYKVFDYFSITSKRYSTTRGDYESLSFVEDISKIKAGSKNAKIILIEPKFEIDSVEIDGWNENFKLNSSGFYFFKNPTESKKHYDQAFNLLEKLKEYSPALCVRDEVFLIYLIGDEVTKEDLEVQQDLEKGYDRLYKLLIKYTQQYKDRIGEVTLWREYRILSIKLKGDDETQMTSLASLCPYMANKSSGYSWISQQPKDELLENIADSIHEMGFIIEFISPKYSDDIKNALYKLKLVEI